MVEVNFQYILVGQIGIATKTVYLLPYRHCINSAILKVKTVKSDHINLKPLANILSFLLI